jgi:hypothetical protein
MKENQIFNLFSQNQRWLTKTPERALEQAYQAALKIREIEIKSFLNEIIYGLSDSAKAFILLQSCDRR